MRYRLLTAVAAAVLTVLPAGAAAATPGKSPLQTALDAVHTAGVPGAFAEVRHGGRTLRLSTGVADVATKAPVRRNSEQRIGSITKSFVATTVLQLVAERRVSLDAPIGRYIGSLVPADLSRAVTVRMLLNHTSGIGDFDTVIVKTPADLITMGETHYTPAELIKLGLSAGSTNAPGAQWSYSNTNYVLAGQIIEKVTGHRYQAEITRRILRPLRLTHTYFEGDDPEIRGPHMQAYVPWTGGTLKDFAHYRMSWASSAGEMVSTAADLDTFYRALLTGRLLPAAQLAQMETTVVENPANPGAGGYGLGLYWVQLPCGKAWGHDGDVIGQQAVSLSSPDGRTQVTYGQNLSQYVLPAVTGALNTFLISALCS